MTKSVKILAVDDDHLICNLYKMMLADAGYDFTVAESGRQAKELLSQKKFDLVIADLMMDDLDGFKLLQFVRDKRLKTRFILVSAYTTKGIEHSFQQLRADAVIHKPFNVSEILAKISEVAAKEPFNPFQPSIARI